MFNRLHAKTRLCTEQAFSLLKRRFPAQKLELQLKNTDDLCTIIVAAMVLHNFCILKGDEEIEFIRGDRPELIEAEPQRPNDEDNDDGNAIRQNIMNALLD